MDPARRLAAESLAADLARTRQAPFVLRVSDRQVQLAIPLPLIVLAGLAQGLVEKNDTTTAAAVRAQFESLQRIYQAARKAANDDNSPTKTFQWSPNLLPASQKDQAQIDNWIHERVIQLEQQAKQSAEILTNDEEDVDREKKRKQIRQRPNKAAQCSLERQPKQNDDCSLSESEAEDDVELERNENGPQQPLVTIARLATQNNLNDNEEKNSNWTTVQRKSAKNGSKIHLDDSTSQISLPADENDTLQRQESTSSPCASKEATNNASISVAGGNEENELVQQIQMLEGPTIALPSNENDMIQRQESTSLPCTSKEATNNGSISVAGGNEEAELVQQIQMQEGPTICTAVSCLDKDFAALVPSSLTETTPKESESEPSGATLRIKQLEEQLATANQLLLDERRLHKRELIKEKEEAQERVQALQLRLYIAETRLKTFEDALEQHNLQVANNVAGSPGRRSSQSPERSRLLRNES